MSEVHISGYCDPKFKEVEKVFRNSIISNFELGASFSVELENQTIIDLWGGFCDADKTRKWERDTIVNVFSVSKAITAICLGRLIERGLININLAVRDYWPEFGCNGKETITVKQLLDHTAGMFAFREGIPIDNWQDWNQYIRLLESQAIYHEPGQHQAYHALTFGWLIGELIKRIDGRTVGEYFRDEVAQPLDIDFKIGLQSKDFGRCADTIMLPTLPSLNQLRPLKFVPDLFLSPIFKNIKKALKQDYISEAFDPSILEDQNFVNTDDWRLAEIPAANGHGTARGLAKLFGILSRGGRETECQILEQHTIDTMREIHSFGPDMVLFGLPYKFGLGFMINAPMTPIGRKKRGNMFGHTGIAGSVAFGDVDKKMGFSFLCNKQHKDLKLYKTSVELADALYNIID